MSTDTILSPSGYPHVRASNKEREIIARVSNSKLRGGRKTYAAKGTHTHTETDASLLTRVRSAIRAPPRAKLDVGLNTTKGQRTAAHARGSLVAFSPDRQSAKGHGTFENRTLLYRHTKPEVDRPVRSPYLMPCNASHNESTHPVPVEDLISRRKLEARRQLDGNTRRHRVGTLVGSASAYLQIAQFVSLPTQTTAFGLLNRVFLVSLPRVTIVPPTNFQLGTQQKPIPSPRRTLVNRHPRPYLVL